MVLMDSKRRDQRSDAAETYRGWYKTKEWYAARAATLRDHPLCGMCLLQERVSASVIVDHIKPHRGDRKLFFDRANLWGLCQPHHDATKQRQERTGIVAGTDAEGRPLDPNHPWNRQR